MWARQRGCAVACRTTSARRRRCPSAPSDGRRRRERRVDRRQERGRGVLPRVQPHQAPPAPVQHPLEGRQVVPFLAVTLDEEWPRAMVMRGAKRGRPLLRAVRARLRHRETLDLLLRTFPIRTCTQASSIATTVSDGRVLCAHIEKVAAPCVGAVQREEYDQLVADLLEFLDGDHSPVLDRLDKQMHGAADSLEYERAARCATRSRRCARSSNVSRWSARRRKTSMHRARRRCA